MLSGALPKYNIVIKEDKGKFKLNLNSFLR
jgi:hypothetical protein